MRIGVGASGAESRFVFDLQGFRSARLAPGTTHNLFFAQTRKLKFFYVVPNQLTIDPHHHEDRECAVDGLFPILLFSIVHVYFDRVARFPDFGFPRMLCQRMLPTSWLVGFHMIALIGLRGERAAED